MIIYNSDFDRQRQRERIEAIRAEYQRVQAPASVPVVAAASRHAQAAWRRVRFVVARRAPAFRA